MGRFTGFPRTIVTSLPFSFDPWAQTRRSGRSQISAATDSILRSPAVTAIAVTMAWSVAATAQRGFADSGSTAR